MQYEWWRWEQYVTVYHLRLANIKVPKVFKAIIWIDSRKSIRKIAEEAKSKQSIINTHIN